MSTEEFHRKLTAILSADVQGYSRLMGEDEESTVRTLTAYRTLMSSLIRDHRGNVVDTPGDNLLARFDSGTDAVRCAVEIQEEFRIRNEDLTENRKMLFRIGINLGDVIEEGDRIYGDGINVAARIEGLAEGGGICISGIVYDAIRNKLSHSYEFIGEHSVKNIKDPVRVYRIKMESEGTSAVIKEKKAGFGTWQRATFYVSVIIILGIVAIWYFSFHQTPADIEKTHPIAERATPVPGVKEVPKTIAVLLFDNVSSDPEQDYFVYGLSEEILNSLAQIPDLSVAGKTSSFSFKGTYKKIQEIASELGVAHILEGSVRKAGDDLRITAQLIRADDGFHLFSKTYDRKLQDIFAVQKDIATAVANELKISLGIGNSSQQLGGTDNVEAYGYYLVAKGYMQNVNDDFDTGLRKSLELLDSAISLDPEFALAWAQKAEYHLTLAALLPKTSVADQLEAALTAAQRSIQIEPDMPEGYLQLIGYHNMKANWFECQENVEKVLELTTEKSPDVEALLALYYNEVGFFEKSQALREMALSKDPYNQLSRGGYMQILACRGLINKAEEEYKLGRTLFKGDWMWGDIVISDIRLGYDTLSRDEIVSPLPAFDAIKEHFESREKALSELRRFYASSDDLSSFLLDNISKWAAYFGDTEFALEVMWQAVRLNAGSLAGIWYPVMHDVRQLPRFKEFVKEIGLVDYWEQFGWPDICRPLENGDFECD